MKYKYLLLSFFLSPLIISCQNYSDNSLAGDLAETSTCPSGGCANTEANPLNLSLSAAGSITLSAPSTAGAISIGGDCNASTYPSNKLRISLKANSTDYTANTIFLAANSEGQLFCKKGRFDLIVRPPNDGLTGLPAKLNYQLKVEIIGVDNTGKEWTNSASSLNYSLNIF